jgi:hypothetical protein
LCYFMLFQWLLLEKALHALPWWHKQS